MGWKGVTIMDQRVRFIAEYLKEYFPFNELCLSVQYQQEDRLQVGGTIRTGRTGRPLADQITTTPYLSP